MLTLILLISHKITVWQWKKNIFTLQMSFYLKKIWPVRCGQWNIFGNHSEFTLLTDFFLTLMRFASVSQDIHFIISTQTKWLNSRNSSSWFCSLCMLRFENQKASLSFCCFESSLLILIWLLLLFVCYALIHRKLLSENPPLIMTVSLNNDVCRF